MRCWRHTANEIRSGNRRALSRAITLAESSHPERRVQTDMLFDALSARKIRQSLRIGLTGAPGVGKSTLINALGAELTQQGKKIAVLAVDPSSERTGGSILGDKTRMETLSREPSAFIRPSPAGNVLGGVAKHTREAIFLCEQAGFDVIFVETTGVGQSESMAGSLTDIFVLLVAPAGGDELQGIKRGNMELADLIAVTKADGELRRTAEGTCAEYSGALRLFARRNSDPDGFPAAMAVSAQDTARLQSLWRSVKELANWRKSNGFWEQIRIQQELQWAKSELQDKIVDTIKSRIDVADADRCLERIISGTGTAFSPQIREKLRSVVNSLNQLTAGNRP